MKIRIRKTDLWAHPNGFWSENGAAVTEIEVTVPDYATDLAINRIIKKEMGIQGWRRDGWCDADWGPWRNGSVGVYADTVEES